MREIVIFGTGLMADEAYMILSCLKQYEVVAFADNDSAKWDTKKNNLPILSAELLCKYPESAVVIASSYYADIAKQLQEIGAGLEYYESVQPLIGTLSYKERQELKALVERKAFGRLRYYNLDYEYRDLSEWNDQGKIGKNT